MVEEGHTVSTMEAYLGLQDALRKIRAYMGSQHPGAWAGVNICIDKKLGVVVMMSQEKWDRMKSICSFWLEQLDQGTSELGYKHLLSDRGFMVNVTQAYPGIKPYLKGFHLSLETWRGGRDKEGWKLTPKEAEQEAARAKERKRGQETEENLSDTSAMDDIKMDLLTQASTSRVETGHGLPGGFTLVAPRFREDLEAILCLAESKQQYMRRRSQDSHGILWL
ncbi:LOW QUALITY PROTEIN: hypothetical protein ACHAW5_007065 [Stephanodiscus triporus]|uniref:Uncharacterized protein n=1 Tax=Stephanodiscus triporus TaxID=2934178 RepID=A0ABD3PWN7_9STRA